MMWVVMMKPRICPAILFLPLISWSIQTSIHHSSAAGSCSHHQSSPLKYPTWGSSGFNPSLKIKKWCSIFHTLNYSRQEKYKPHATAADEEERERSHSDHHPPIKKWETVDVEITSWYMKRKESRDRNLDHHQHHHHHDGASSTHWDADTSYESYAHMNIQRHKEAKREGENGAPMNTWVPYSTNRILVMIILLYHDITMPPLFPLSLNVQQTLTHKRGAPFSSEQNFCATATTRDDKREYQTRNSIFFSVHFTRIWMCVMSPLFLPTSLMWCHLPPSLPCLDIISCHSVMVVPPPLSRFNMSVYEILG